MRARQAQWKRARAGSGENLDMPPALAIQLAVTVQLQGNDRCWEASYDQAQRNREDLFVAKGSPGGAFL